MFHLVNLQISMVFPYFKITIYINNVKNSEKEDNLNMMVPLFKIVYIFTMLLRVVGYESMMTEGKGSELNLREMRG